MLIKNSFEVAQPIESVWVFFQDIPQVAACLPGAELNDLVGDDKYVGKVAIKLGPVKLQFAGSAQIKERNDSAKRIVVDAAGADEKGRGQAALMLTASLTPTSTGTKVDVLMDLQLSGAAADTVVGLFPMSLKSCSEILRQRCRLALARSLAGNLQIKLPPQNQLVDWR